MVSRLLPIPLAFIAVLLAEGAEAQRVSFLQYNVQFLTPWDCELSSCAISESHWPNTQVRAEAIAQATILACADFAALEETTNPNRRRQLLAALDQSGVLCGRPSLLPTGRQFESVDGPDLAPGWVIPTPEEITDLVNANANPIVDDELTIVSRFPVIATHSHKYSLGSGEDGFAAKGALHARLWRGFGQASDSIDVFATHLDTAKTIRRTQIAELALFVGTHSSPYRPAILLGDFNIDGSFNSRNDHASEYTTLVTSLSAQVGSVMDIGTALGGTDEQRDHRIDLVFTFRQPLPAAGVTVQDMPHPTAALPKVTLSDHAAVSGRLSWPLPQFVLGPRWPDVADAKRVSVEVLRLQAKSSDSCNAFMDFFGSASIDDAASIDRARFGLLEGNDIGPDWKLEKMVAPGVPSATVVLSVRDDDDFFCGGGDDQVDVNPSAADAHVRLLIDFASSEVRLLTESGTVVSTVGRLGEPLFFEGDGGRERARITLVANASLVAAPNPIPLPTSRKMVTVTVNRLQATTQDSCNQRMDFWGQLDLRLFDVTLRMHRFPVMEGNDIAPGWSVQIPAPPEAAFAESIVRIFDDDNFLCGGDDDLVDVNPHPEQVEVSSRIDLRNGQIESLDNSRSRQPTGQILGVAGTPIVLEGFNGREKARMTVTFTITPL